MKLTKQISQSVEAFQSARAALSSAEVAHEALCDQQDAISNELAVAEQLVIEDERAGVNAVRKCRERAEVLAIREKASSANLTKLRAALEAASLSVKPQIDQFLGECSAEALQIFTAATDRYLVELGKVDTYVSALGLRGFGFRSDVVIPDPKRPQTNRAHKRLVQEDPAAVSECQKIRAVLDRAA